MKKRLFLIIIAVAYFVLMIPLAAHAEGEVIAGTLVYRSDGERTPVEGVRITVTLDGTEIGVGVSDEEGRWEVSLPGPGTYSVTLDVETLPEDVSLTDPSRFVLARVDVITAQRKAVIFPLGEGATRGVSVLARVGGLFVAGLKLGATIALAAVGLSLVYGVTGLVNFAHGETVTLGAVVAFLLSTSVVGPGWPLVLAIVPTVALLAAYGGLQDRFLWRPLRRLGVGSLSVMVVSIGLSFAVRSLIQFIFGGQPRAFSEFAGQSSVLIMGIPMVPKHLVTIGAALVILFLVGLFLQKGRTGTAMRAVSDDRNLAESSGIDVNRVMNRTWILAAGLAGVAGVFLGVNESVQYDMGFRLLLLLFAAVVLGGLGTVYGVMIGSFVVGVAVEVSTLWLPSELKGTAGLAILIIMLLVRPHGLFGARERIG